MPIGTPKISYTHHEKTIFLTLQEKLYDGRILFLCKNMEFSLVNNIIALLLFLSGQDDTDIHLFINSHGGEALSAISLYDTIEFLYCDVSTVALGLVASTASLILVGGTRTKRIAFPHARIMIHQPSTNYFCGNPREMQVEAEELFELRNTITEIYAQNTGQPVNIIQNDLERDTFMSATEAQDYGIIDHIAIEKFR
uniref:clp protease proteolytic subunit n=2 Tax=cellular organisms TaxID=131567 RepID=UPI001F146307|nr:clp protease proteolytic subunit [Cyperus flavidus]YP_010292633.1 clp protease proteolytic subunit [Cyperus michelianus]ULQ64825.1 clp protease proteolytic subunit [Cyperus michelianus]ULQ67490.1 clp protease proteolytic subunit [Cyperus flavidus]